jgi:hypothetical protein
MELSDWDACAGWKELPADAPCYLGLDLSDRNDLTPLIKIRGDFEREFDVACQFWLPRENIAKLERQHCGAPSRSNTLDPPDSVGRDRGMMPRRRA